MQGEHKVRKQPEMSTKQQETGQELEMVCHGHGSNITPSSYSPTEENWYSQLHAREETNCVILKALCHITLITMAGDGTNDVSCPFHLFTDFRFGSLVCRSVRLQQFATNIKPTGLAARVCASALTFISAASVAT